MGSMKNDANRGGLKGDLKDGLKELLPQILSSWFGYSSFRPLQEEIITSILSGHDSLAVMPTGGGKSLCYQVPALVFKGMTLVISPLISLMQDQVSQLEQFGISAVCLNSSLADDEYRSNMSRIARGEVKLLYLAPETLLLERTLSFLAERRIDAIAIDEAHCISEWGHDFRPEYRRLAELRNHFPGAVRLALTATATERVRKDIAASLGFSGDKHFIAGFDRPNLQLEVRLKSEPRRQILNFLSALEGEEGHQKAISGRSGIIYCSTRKKVDDLTGHLTGAGYSAASYHAGLSDQKRRENQDHFIRDDVQIIVATIAFGMGINKPDVRFVIHHDLPKDIESYYQQIGRAGRDGLPARCLLLFGYGDIITNRYFIDKKEGTAKRVAENHLAAMTAFAETHLCRRVPLLTWFGENPPERCGNCDNCLGPAKEEEDLTVVAQKFLSCVYRTGELFGAAHIIDVLRGSKAQKVTSRGHEKLSTWGIGLEYAKEQWFQLARLLLQMGLLRQDPEYGSLKLGTGCREVLKGERKVRGYIDPEAGKRKGKQPSRRLGGRSDGNSGTSGEGQKADYDRQLFDLLAARRKELADRAKLPPYVIFHDTTLIAMATSFPETSEELLSLHGVGKVKLERYGEEFLQVIRDFLSKRA